MKVSCPKRIYYYCEEQKMPTGKMNKLEYAAAYLTPQDPVANNLNTNRKRGASEISNTYGGGAQVS